MSFLQRIIYDIYNANKDSEGRRDEKSLNDMTVKDIMNPEPLFLKEDATFNQIIEAFVAHHKVNPIPIIDNDGKLVGVVSRFDVLRPLNLLGYHTNK